MSDSRERVSYYDSIYGYDDKPLDLWRCKDGVLRSLDGGMYDVGRWDVYLRVPIQDNREGTIRINMGEASPSFPNNGVMRPLPETTRPATKTDTNFPHLNVYWDNTLSLLELSWHLQVAPANVEAVQQFLGQTLFEFYTGGDKPYYQCNMAIMAHWEPYAVCGTYTLIEPLPLHYVEKRWVDLQLAKASGIPLDLFLRMGCRRYRGIA